jgi:pimeloyl-ACP methyl ester carboxylesterase
MSISRRQPVVVSASPRRAAAGTRHCHRSALGVASLLVVLAASLLTGCTSSKPAPLPTTSASGGFATATAGANASYASVPCPNPILPGVLSADLGPTVRCGYLTVPEDRSKPTWKKIRLAVALVPAKSIPSAPDPIVFLAGGPGSSGIVGVNQAVAEGLNAHREAIFIDQRGTLKSRPNLTCPEFDLYFKAALSEPFLAPATRAQSETATKACHDRLVADGVDLAAYSTAENAQDIADLRVALGIKEWNVYGVSYGTDLALTMLRDDPRGIRSVVLDSVVPPNKSIIPALWPAAAEGLYALIEGCAKQRTCAAAYPDLLGDFNTAVNTLNTSPVTVTVPDATGAMVKVLVDGYQFANTVVLLSAAGGLYADGTAMIHQMADGDGTMVAKLMLAFAPPVGLYAWGLQWSAICPEFVSQTSLAQVVSEGKKALPQVPAAVLKLLPQFGPFFADCPIWNVGKAPASAHAPVKSTVPVLMMGGTFDAITPISWQDDLRPGLKNSQSVAFPGLGHDVLAQSPCAGAVMNAFLTLPRKPVDQTCVSQMKLPNFITP